MFNKYCLLLRGKPASGKSTLLKYLAVNALLEFTEIDPDKVNVKNREYKQFTPQNNKNPSENVKMYCYLFHKAKESLESGNNVIWSQPWSRVAEVALTIRNFYYYFVNQKDSKMWNTPPHYLLNNLPFKLIFVTIDVSEETSRARYIERIHNNATSEDLKRLDKTNKLFQELGDNYKQLILNGEHHIETNSKLLIEYLKEFSTPKKTDLMQEL